ncbi:MAG TPA: response regulator [Ramlibacter sp.]|nr:response regulator [Ramlibacter sp.]
MANLLLIEDDPHQRALASLVLESAGHTVREAGDGDEGLRLAVDDPPELIVCDVVMPGMNGYQLVAAVRKHPTLGATPVILLTSLAERAQMRAGMTAGADDYLPKPFRPEELVEAVHSVLERRRAQYQAIAGSVQDDMDAALARQREMLAARYETQLLQELNAKWNQSMEAGGQASYDVATVLAADLFEVIERHGAAAADPADLLKRAHEAARDALYLFGAVQVLPHRPDVLAVFKPDEAGRPATVQPVRAAFALQAAMARVLGSGAAQPGLPTGPTIALDVGAFSVLRLQDPLHGDGGTAPVPGPTLERVQALRAFAREQGWAVAATADTAAGIGPELAAVGRTGTFRHGAAGRAMAVELVRPQA